MATNCSISNLIMTAHAVLNARRWSNVKLEFKFDFFLLIWVAIRWILGLNILSFSIIVFENLGKPISDTLFLIDIPFSMLPQNSSYQRLLISYKQRHQPTTSNDNIGNTSLTLLFLAFPNIMLERADTASFFWQHPTCLVVSRQSFVQNTQFFFALNRTIQSSDKMSLLPYKVGEFILISIKNVYFS